MIITEIKRNWGQSQRTFIWGRTEVSRDWLNKQIRCSNVLGRVTRPQSWLYTDMGSPPFPLEGFNFCACVCVFFLLFFFLRWVFMIYQCLVSAYQCVFPSREVPWKGLAVKAHDQGRSCSRRVEIRRGTNQWRSACASWISRRYSKPNQ